MRRHSRTAASLTTGVVFASGLVMSAVMAAPPASATPGARVCPTTDFWIGAGWGADRGRRIHTGIDMAGKRGTPIFAVEDGVIDRTKRQSNGALQIVMRGESGSKFYYGHMDEVLVSGGQRVRAGDVIGHMGDSGSPGSVHLHFEFWRSGGESDAVDPQPLIARICDLSPNGTTGTAGARPAQESADDDPAPKPADPAPKPPADVVGQVFQN